jgi:hypothetical protein
MAAKPRRSRSRVARSGAVGSPASTTPEKAARPAPARPADPADAVAEAARRLRAGEISAAQAIELLIDDAVRRRTPEGAGSAAASAALAERLRQMLRRHAESDPFLLEKRKRLGDHS